MNYKLQRKDYWSYAILGPNDVQLALAIRRCDNKYSILDSDKSHRYVPVAADRERILSVWEAWALVKSKGMAPGLNDTY